MGLKVIITGATGMVGKGVLFECLDDARVDRVLCINRQPLGMQHPKLKEIIQSDFFHGEKVHMSLQGYDTCFFCLGVTSVGMNESEYSRITFELTLGFAKELLVLNPGMTFCYISGAGTDSTEKGKQMWARVKGRTENALLGLGFKNAYMFRPGFIQPRKGIRSKTKLYSLVYDLIGPFYFIWKKFPRYVTNTETLGRAMIHVALQGYNKSILESEDINKLGSAN